MLICGDFCLIEFSFFFRLKRNAHFPMEKLTESILFEMSQKPAISSHIFILLLFCIKIGLKIWRMMLDSDHSVDLRGAILLCLKCGCHFPLENKIESKNRFVWGPGSVIRHETRCQVVVTNFLTIIVYFRCLPKSNVYFRF